MPWNFLEEADVRLITLVAIFSSLFAGYLLPIWALLLITLIAVVMRSILLEESRRAPAEGGIGYYYAAIGLVATIIVPMWVMCLIRYVF